MSRPKSIAPASGVPVAPIADTSMVTASVGIPSPYLQWIDCIGVVQLFCAPARHSRQLDKLAHQNAYQLRFKNGSIHNKLILVKMKLAIETLHMFIFYTGFYFQNVMIVIRRMHAQ